MYEVVLFGKGVLRRMFGSKWDEMVPGWRKLRYKELHIMYSSSRIIRIIKSKRVRLAEHVVRMGENMNACKILVVKPEGKSSLGKPRSRWYDNIKMDDMDWVGLAQDRDQWIVLLNTAANLRVPQNFGRFLSRLAASQEGLSSMELVN
jgi:hypothetical protein